MPASSSELIDKKLAIEAYAKAARGETLNRAEKSALKRFEKQREEELRWQYYQSIPQKHWRQMSGRQTKVINEQAERYGLPMGGRTIDLTKLAKRLHDFLAANAHKLASTDEMMSGAASPALEEYRRERAALARLERLEREGELLPRDQARDALGRIAAILRGSGDALQRQFGVEALDILLEALNEAGEEITRSFGASSDTDTNVSTGQ